MYIVPRSVSRAKTSPLHLPIERDYRKLHTLKRSIRRLINEIRSPFVLYLLLFNIMYKPYIFFQSFQFSSLPKCENKLHEIVIIVRRYTFCSNFYLLVTGSLVLYYTNKLCYYHTIADCKEL